MAYRWHIDPVYRTDRNLFFIETQSTAIFFSVEGGEFWQLTRYLGAVRGHAVILVLTFTKCRLMSCPVLSCAYV